MIHENNITSRIMMVFLLLWMGISHSADAPTIRVICTAALIPHQWDTRKQEYITGITTIKNFGFDTYVVEPCLNAPTFLDELSLPVCYTKSNDLRLRNKGINEAISLRAFLDQYNFSDDDMIIKCTGRYYFTSDAFFRTVQAHPEADAVVRYTSNSEVYESCYALRYKYFKEMLNTMDLETMEQQMINIGHEVASYLYKHPSFIIIGVAELGINARVASNNFIEHF